MWQGIQFQVANCDIFSFIILGIWWTLSVMKLRCFSFQKASMISSVQFSLVTQSCPTLCDPMNCSTPGLSPSPTSGIYPNSCPLSWWCHPTISSSVVTFSSHLQSFPVSGSFKMSQFFASGGQSIGVSASTSVLPKNTQDWSPYDFLGNFIFLLSILSVNVIIHMLGNLHWSPIHFFSLFS